MRSSARRWRWPVLFAAMGFITVACWFHRPLALLSLESLAVAGPCRVRIWAVKASERYGVDALPILEAGFERKDSFESAAEVAGRMKLLISIRSAQRQLNRAQGEK